VRYVEDNLVSFVPRILGYFKICVRDNQGPILGSPFYVLIHPPKDKDEKELIELSGIKDVLINDEAKFIIKSKEFNVDVQIVKSKFLLLY
jgi:hypothetical protein